MSKIKILIGLALLLLCQTVFGQRSVSVNDQGVLQGTISQSLFAANSNRLMAALASLPRWTNNGYIMMTNVTAAVPNPPVGYVSFFASNDTLYALSSGGVMTDLASLGLADGDKGDITVSGSGATFTIDNNVVNGAKIALGSDAQGDIMYYNGTDYVRLAPGTSGQFLQTLGAAANPQWATSSGLSDGDKGDITVSASGATFTIDNNVVTGAKIALGSDAQGDVMYYNGTDWVRLAAGTSGHFLKTLGPGANPAWDAAGGSATAINDIGDATGSGTISLGTTEQTITATRDGSTAGILRFYHSLAPPIVNPTTMLRLDMEDNSVDTTFIHCVADYSSAPIDVFKLTAGTLYIGASTGTTIDGSLVVSGNFTLSAASIGFPDGVRQTFNPNGTTPGFSVGSIAGDPSTPSNGDMWYDSTANELTARINGANVALGSGGGADGTKIATNAGFGYQNTFVQPTNSGRSTFHGAQAMTKTNMTGGSTAPHPEIVMDGPGFVVATLTNNTIFGFTHPPSGSLVGLEMIIRLIETNEPSVTPYTVTFSNIQARAGSDLHVVSGATNYFFVRWDGTNATIDSAQTLTSGTGAYARTNAPTINNVTLIGTAVVPNGSADIAMATAGQIHLNTTDEQLAFHSAADGEISGEVVLPLILTKSWTFDPKAVCDGAVDRLFLMWIQDDAPEGIIIDEWKISFEADPTTEVDLDLKYADAMIGVANAVTVDALDTTTGTATEDTDANINSGNAIPTGKVLYLEFGTAYSEANHQIMFQIWYHVEED